MTRRHLFWAGFAVLLAALGSLWIAQGSRAGSRSGPVDELLSQSMKDSAGRVQSLGQWRNRPLVVNFWATWCAPCVKEIPELSALQTQLTPHHIQIIGIGIDSPENIAEFGKKYNIAYPLYTGGMDASELTRKLGDKEGGLPFTVVIGRDGKVVRTFLGKLKMDELRAELDRL